MQLKVTEKIKLKTLTEENSQELFDLVNENRDYLAKWLNWASDMRTLEDIQNFISKEESEFNTSLSANFGIFTDNKLIGSCGYSNLNNKHLRGTISYWLIESEQKKGTMTKCVKRLLEYGFNELELNKARIQVGTDNIRSMKIPERLRFKRDGVLRKHIRVGDRFEDLIEFSMLKKESPLERGGYE